MSPEEALAQAEAALLASIASLAGASGAASNSTDAWNYADSAEKLGAALRAVRSEPCSEPE